MNWFNINSNKIYVVGNGVEEIFFEKGKENTYNSNGPFISIGGLNFMDGGDRVVKFANYLQKCTNQREIIIAGDQHDLNILKDAKKNKNIKILGYLHKEELANKMSDSSMLLFFTRYETFGIAAAEAMSLGIPVLTTRSTAVPEIVSSSGIYVDFDTISNKYFDDLLNNKFQNNILLGKKLAEKYRWSICVERLVKILNDKIINQ